MDDDPKPYSVFNGTTKSVLYDGAAATNATWVSPTSFKLAGLAAGEHTVRVALADATGRILVNPESTANRLFSIVTSLPITPLLKFTGPAPEAEVPGPVLVSFVTANHTIGLKGTPHARFYIDDDTTPHEFYVGPGMDEITGVVYQNAHTHYVHWQSPTSFAMYAWPPGPHTVRMVLVDAVGNELPNPEASETRTFTITGSSGLSEFVLESVLPGVEGDSISFTGTGKLFFTDGRGDETVGGAVKVGKVWVVDTTTEPWTRKDTPFYQTNVSTIGEQGLTGVLADPNYAVNQFVYIFFTKPDGVGNRVVRVKDVNGQATEETIILDDPLASDQHNGGVMKFGPDGKLYVTMGDATQPELAQNVQVPNGKILRLNSDGTIPPDNPFPNSKVWAYGLRNSFGMTFHPVTGDLWATENGTDIHDEVNRIVKGGNYGWPVVTGIAQNPAYLDPVYNLATTVGITNIVALAATDKYPTIYHNNLFFTDFVEGKIRRLELGADHRTLVRDSEVFDGGVGGLISLAQGPDGYIYVGGTGGVYRMKLNANTGH
ncbi:MAG: PQQ-dependent sugar dehydrogenase [Nitrospiraceae bacterium]